MYVNCTYDTTKANSPTYFGLGTSDEMCFMIALVHPIDQQVPTSCVDSDGFGFCEGEVFGDWRSCNMYDLWAKFQDPAFGEDLWMGLAGKCDDTGLTCKEGCPEAIEATMAKHPCLSGKSARIVRGFMALGSEDKRMVNMLISCTDQEEMKAEEEDLEKSMEEYIEEDMEEDMEEDIVKDKSTEDKDDYDKDHDHDHDHKDHDHGKWDEANKLPQTKCIFDVEDKDKDKDDDKPGSAPATTGHVIIYLAGAFIALFMR